MGIHMATLRPPGAKINPELGVNEQVDIFGEEIGNLADNVAAQQGSETTARRGTQQQFRGAHGCSDVHDGFGGGIANAVTRKNGVTLSMVESVGKNLAGVLVILPFAILIGLGEG